MSISSKDFEQFREELQNKRDEVYKTFEEMKQKYNECDDFSNNVLKTNNWHINNDQKAKEEKLLEEYKGTIEKWQKALDDLTNFYNKHIGIN